MNYLQILIRVKLYLMALWYHINQNTCGYEKYLQRQIGRSIQKEGRAEYNLDRSSYYSDHLLCYSACTSQVKLMADGLEVA